MHADAADVPVTHLDLARVNRGPDLEPQGRQRFLEPECAAERAGWGIEGRQEPVARGLDHGAVRLDDAVERQELRDDQLAHN